MKGVFIAVVCIILLLGAIFYLKTVRQPIHFHSGFQIYIDDKQQDYSGAKYMSLVPCTNDGHEVETKDKVHLHDGIGEILHVHQANVVWGDLFSYLKLSLPSDKPVDAYLNGTRVDSVAQKKIHAYDSLVLLIGKHGDVSNYLDKSPSKTYIRYMESRDGLCKG